MPGATGDLLPDQELEIGGLTVKPLHTPGHTAGMLSLLVGGTDVFTGDTLFKGSVGGVRAPGSTSYDDLKRSIMEVLLALPPETTIRPGHTDPTTVGDELQTNGFVRIWRGEDDEDGRECTAMGETGDARAARRRLRRRAQGVGALARRPGRHRARLAGLASVRGDEPREVRRSSRSPPLLIASASAAAAALVVPLLWEGGGVVAAAITPVIVTLVSESLKRPVTKVQEVGVWRSTPQGTAVRQPAGRDFDPVDPEEERIEVDPQHPDDPFGLYEDERGGRGGFFTRRKVMIALVTGLIAFGIAAVVVTAGELTFGDSTSSGSKTTFFGGRRSSTPTPTPTPTATPKEGETPTPTPSASATPSATPGTQATATPSATATPNAVAPATQATPAPTP